MLGNSKLIPFYPPQITTTQHLAVLSEMKNQNNHFRGITKGYFGGFPKCGAKLRLKFARPGALLPVLCKLIDSCFYWGGKKKPKKGLCLQMTNAPKPVADELMYQFPIMPLSEFLRLAIEKLESSKQKARSTDVPAQPESNLIEVAWENGPSHHSLSPSTPSVRHDTFGNPTTANFGRVVSTFNGDSLAMASGPLDSSQNEDVIPWLSLPVDDGLNMGKAIPQSYTGCASIAGRVSCEQSHNLKRKLCDIDSETHSDDIKTECVRVKKPTSAREGVELKRNRSAEVHNLSERRRRGRINEKLRALQELVPYCNKADKASMLDEAIQYIKNLQHQVQNMSMAGGLHIPSTMFPMGSQHMYPPPMPHFSPMAMGNGTGMRMSFGNFNCVSLPRPVYPVPSIQGSHFSSSPLGPINYQGTNGPNLLMHRHLCPQLCSAVPRAPLAHLARNKVATTSSNLNPEYPIRHKNPREGSDQLNQRPCK